ncbi:MAG TPA: winged helix-turn-helix domain-containing protein [Acidimicrobiales bacterium]|nr:winged helix-turn-helix domain-containing protein [Acidimicrobiales bacterium]
MTSAEDVPTIVPNPDEIAVVSDPIAVDAINDPLRWRIYRQLVTPKTVKDLGEILGLRPARLYYHLKLLERHGWIKVAEERRTDGNSPERVYQTAYQDGAFQLADSVTEQEGYNQDGWRIGAQQEMFAPFDEALDLIIERGYPPEATAAGFQRFRRVPRERMIEMIHAVHALIEECMGSFGDAGHVEGEGDPEAPRFGVLFMVEPFLELPSHLKSSPPASGR